MRNVITFSEDDDLIANIRDVLDSSNVTLIFRKRLNGDEGQYLTKKSVFLVHFHGPWQKTLVEALCRNFPSINTRLLLLADSAHLESIRSVLKEFNLDGYVPLESLASLLPARILNIFEPVGERRHHARYRVRLPVFYTKNGSRRTGICTSLSQGGMFIQTLDKPGVDANVNIAVLKKAAGNSDQFDGRVVYCVPSGFGAKLNASITNLDQFIAV
jgi:hypothetical protein